MKNLYISIFLASIIAITSCEGGGGGPAPVSGCTPVSIFIPAGEAYSVNGPDGTISGIAPEGGITVNGCVPTQ